MEGNGIGLTTWRDNKRTPPSITVKLKWGVALNETVALYEKGADLLEAESAGDSYRQ